MAWKASSWWCAALGALVLLGAVPARAAEAPLAQVRLSAELLDEILAGLLPATVAAPRGMAEGEEQRLRLLGVRYCGPGEKGTGRFRALARRERGEAPPAAPACAGTLAEWAERATPAFAEGTFLVELEASWKS